MKYLLSFDRDVLSRVLNRTKISLCGVTKLFVGCLVLVITLGTGVSADDTEIYFPRNTAQPNVLFVLDLSQSMEELDGGTETRLERMQEALIKLLEKSGGSNIGIMTFSTSFSTWRDQTKLQQPVLPLSDKHRADMIATVSSFAEAGGTPTLKALLKSAQYFRGELQLSDSDTDTYVSPILHECQENHVVLLTDGQPSRDPGSMSLVTDVISDDENFECERVNVGTWSNNGTCATELASYMRETDHSNRRVGNNIAGHNNVITHTIGLNFDEDRSKFAEDAVSSPEWLKAISDAGGGLNFNANSADSLLTAFDAILGNVNATLAAPSVSVNSFNEVRHSDELYYTFFQPKLTSRWDGNVKKYRLVDGQIVDRNGNALINDAGGVDELSQSLWAHSADGKQVKDGGMAALQPKNRNWFIDTGAADRRNNISVIKVRDGADVNRNWVDAATAAERDNIVAFVRGADVLDQNVNDITDEPSRYVADSLHGSPLLLSYWAKAATDTSNEERNEVLFSANNMGVLHAVDAQTGEEKWSYSPRELLPNIKRYMDNASGDHVYGLDGNMVLHTTYKARTSYEYEDDTAWLYLTQRRGGRSIYALDVSKRRDPFKVLWKINGNTDREFRNLGQTWATPQVIPIRYGCPDHCEVKDVLMFGGGYNPLYDNKNLKYPVKVNANSTGHGNAIYLVDLETGELIWSAGKGEHHKLNLDINDSVPETPVPVDTDADGAVDVLFFSDIAGHVWRVDLDRNANEADDLAISGGMIAALSPEIKDVEQPLRFFNRIDVVINGTTNSTASFNLVLGSGMRSSPLYVEPFSNRIYSIRDPWVYSSPIGDELDDNGVPKPEYRYVKDEDNNTREIITPASLTKYVESTDLSTQTVTDTEYFGFYKVLDARAEKILQSTVTHAGRIFLVSYVPPVVGEGGCGFQLGESRLQILDVEYGTNLATNSYRPYKRVGSGIVSNGTIVDTGSGDGPSFIMGINSEKMIELIGDENLSIYRRFFRTGWSELDD